MTRYMLSVHSTGDESRAPMSDEQMRRSHQELGLLEEEMQRTGAWVFSGRLSDSTEASVVRVSGADVLISDGPFAESKEHLGGFYIIEAEDQEAALAWAAKVTGAVGAPIEVRSFVATAGA